MKKVLEPHCRVQGYRSQGLAQEHNCWTQTQVYQISNMLVFLMLPLVSLGKFREIHIQDPPSTGFLSSACVPRGTQISGKFHISLILRCILIQFYVSDMKIIKMITFEILGNLEGLLGTAFKCLFQLPTGSVPLSFYSPVPQGVGLIFGTGSATSQPCGSVVLSGI